jgi:IS1 family transposase
VVDRDTRCFLGYGVVPQRTPENMQDCLDSGPRAGHYYSDAFSTYDLLVYYPARHEVAPGKSETYSVEGDNAELRHYLKRLARKSRCFSRSIKALWRFVFCWNKRQIHNRTYPHNPFSLGDCLSPIF